MGSSDLNIFLRKIMEIKVLSMGGTSAGIFGISRADDDVLNSLKKSAVAFAKEYTKSDPGAGQLQKYSQEIEGNLQILALTNTISGDTADKLTDELQTLMEKTSV